ncbi:SUKH-3 domain-containing protein [Catenuloplanes japonicus]|uniref:SUKH-3 domain-containing protein n=1 Tax=Catenuloplanes japonicus TaxID=33876 RepID=UPI000527E305|nr:SUKH-3 domain-containing protein [Catenuloplanes japonicus]
MITREEADAVAAVWAARDSQRRGYDCTPMVHEFDQGFLVWSRQPHGVMVQPDDGGTTVIDRVTGEISSYPSLPPDAVAQQYRQARAVRGERILTADPQVELRRLISRLPVPTTAIHLTVGSDQHGYEMFIARGAKGDQTLNHHPLVVAYLNALPRGHVVRGGDRHAELIVLSDALHEYDRRRAAVGWPLLTVDDARLLFQGCQFETHRVREPGDPNGGKSHQPAESSIRALVHFGVLHPDDLVWAEEMEPWAPPPGVADPDPARFPPDVCEVLKSSAWEPSFSYPMFAQASIDVAVQAGGHTPFPAAVAALTAFPSLVSMRRRPGRDVWIRQFDIDPRETAHNAATLADFGRVIGSRLFPIGTEEGDSILAVDERGYIFAIDQAGEWFIAPGIDQAVIALIQGHGAARVRDDGSW